MTAGTNETVVALDSAAKRFSLPARSALPDGRTDEEGRLIALEPLSLKLQPGESLGVVGSNGAGKTTLLRLIAGVTQPTTGSVAVKGPVVSLLTLQAGLDPRSTGRNRIHTFGTLLGLSRNQIAYAFDHIVDFSGIGAFLDQPVSTYSPGMAARLSFSVALQISAPVYVVDEILGAGDPVFQARASDVMQSKLSRGAVAIVASHSLPTLADLCTHAAWLEQGRLMALGTVSEVFATYQAATGHPGGGIDWNERHASPEPAVPDRQPAPPLEAVGGKKPNTSIR